MNFISTVDVISIPPCCVGAFSNKGMLPATGLNAFDIIECACMQTSVLLGKQIL